MERSQPQPAQQLTLVGLAALMVLAFLTSLDGFWHMHDPWLRLVPLALAAAGLAWLWWRYPRPLRWVVFVLLPALATVSLWWGVTRPRAVAFLFLLKDFIPRFLHNPFTTMEPVLAYSFLVLSTLLIAGFIVWEALHRGDGFWSLGIGTLLFGTQWLMYYDNSDWFILYCTAGVLLWAIARSARRGALWQAQGRRLMGQSALGAAAGLCIGLTLFCLVAPSDIAPVSLGRYAHTLQQAIPGLEKLRGGGGEGGSGKTGFSDALHDLGGPVTPDNTPVFDVQTSGAIYETLYLRGDARVFYDGKTWSGRGPGPVAQPAGDRTPLPAIYAPKVPTQSLQVKITPDIAGQREIFTVLETAGVSGLAVPANLSPGSILTAAQPLPRGKPYTLDVRLPAVAIPTLAQVSFADLEPLKGQREFAPYLQVPATLPRRVRDLAQQVTADSRTPYEAAAKLENYLRTTYPYSLEAPGTPAGRDFVDYFLFDARKGYCTYYSSALAVMLRTLGIPARWAFGYAVAPPAADEIIPRTSNQEFTVRDSDAHAWVEVYFPDYGWITFDPTPRYSAIFRSPTLPGETTPPPVDTTPPAPAAESGSSFSLLKWLQGLGWWVWSVLGALALLGLAWLGLSLRLRRLAALPADDSVRAVQAVWDNLELLMAQMGTARRPAETVREYAARIGQVWPQLNYVMEGMPEAYAAARYGSPGAVAGLGPELLPKVRALWQAAEQAARDQYGALGFYWRRLRGRRSTPS